MPPNRLSTKIACRVARLDRQRFNELVAAGAYPCAPATIPGRARYFDPDDMVGLWIFRELMEEGYSPNVAGHIACEVSGAARKSPDAETITLARHYIAGDVGFAMRTDQVPAPDTWSTAMLHGTNIRSATTFNIRYTRELIAYYVAEELSYIGDDD